MREFIYQAHPMRVRFGVRAFDVIAEEVEQLGLQHVAVLCMPGRAELGQLVARALGSLCVGVIAKAVMHVPREVAVETIAEIQALGAEYLSVFAGRLINAAEFYPHETIAQESHATYEDDSVI